LALVDKPADALDTRREKSVPLIFASELKEHRETPAVQARLARVAALVDARRREATRDNTPPA